MAVSSELLLISEIQKRPCLYNYTLHDYNKKEVFGPAWKDIAVTCQMTVPECKDKWKNIRSSYVRSLRGNGTSKSKKPYYLSNYLQFLTPFLKSIEPNNEVESADNSGMSDSEAVLPALKEEEVDLGIDAELDAEVDEELDAELDARLDADLDAGPSSFENNGNAIEMCVTQPNVLTINPGAPTARKRRRVKLPTQAAKMRNSAPAFHVIAPPSYQDRDNAMRMFMLSLLPEFQSMSENQLRLFKIKVMMLIDDIKTRPDEVKKNLKSDTESNIRLQKKLINLLIKHLPDGGGNDELREVRETSKSRAFGENETYFDTTVHGNPVLVCGGQRYNRSNQGTHPSFRERWYCSQRNIGCRACIHTLRDEIVKHVNEHNHL